MGVSRIVSTAVRQNVGSPSHASEKFLINDPLIILDWDDTLFPNTHLAKLGFSSEDKAFVIPQDCVSTLNELAEEVEKFLIACLNIGTCCIVTNGQSGWVERSCKRFLPNVVPLLEKITIISARSCFEKVYPDRPIEWKIAVYQDLLAKHGYMQMSRLEPRDDCIRQQEHETQQVIALGDSQGDRCAIQYVARRTPYMQLKSIKLLDNPTITQLQKQLKILGVFLEQLSCHDETLDLELSNEMLQ
ncbi:HAD-like domain [Plasmopara halstedii]|uniref:HAD-like domain n=1 Tax=Plasmopara halstedii TaxID=4781 RepID=A0A0N7L5X6_PLAHL|nr:HAD-like domain [Plasmopara halstedii]CEG42699.1 HAD-like domain [Plasmopara halstedii]|eukprot:XP_024579068.1 HAD-like domain [Plasmopara halstedii]